MIYLTLDLHFCHDKEFVYKSRGFDSIYAMNDAIVNNWNNTVSPDDKVYLLGDVMLNDNEEGFRLLKSLNGHIHIIIGNHDTDARVELYKSCQNVEEITYATIIKYGKYRFYLSHYPTYTSNFDDTPVKQKLLNLYGHTHQTTKFFDDVPFMYHVGVDAHQCAPVGIEDIITDIKLKVME